MANTDLRRLMQFKKTTSNKISHPLAKYNNLGQLSCVICSKIIKDNAVWNAHLQSKKHKENVLLLKTKSKPTSSSSTLSSNKSINKNYKNDHSSQLSKDFFDQKSSEGLTAKDIPLEPKIDKPKSILKGSQDYLKQNGVTPPITVQPKTPQVSTESVISSNPTSSTKTLKECLPANDEPEGETSSNRKRKLDSALPSDFFDEPKKEEKNEKTSIENGKTDAESKLPEGFFDDPKKDAEARNIEYKDPKEKEWEMFQKMIEEETKVAETIQEEEDEESEMQKDMTEYNKLKSCLSRVKYLKNLVTKEKLKQTEAVSSVCENEDSGDSDEDMDDVMFDWRAKTL